MTTNPTLPPAFGTPADARTDGLRQLCGGAVHRRGDAGYDDARVPWNVAVDQRPAAVAYPASPAEVAEVVRAARRAGLRVAPQGTGHNAGPLGALEDVVLLRTAAMRDVLVDPTARTARVDAGVLWQDAVEEAAGHDLAALHGSSPDVGVVGYSLGGGIGWYARALGLQANSVTAVELVTAEGEQVRADERHEPDLFWAVRGGGGSFGVVTALEFALYPVSLPYAGMLVWDAAEAERVLRRWTEWAAEAPDHVTTAFRILAVPPVPQMPEPFRGRTVVVVDGAVLGNAVEGAAVLAGLTELAPEVNSFAPVPAHTLTRLHLDPEGPTPSVSHSAMLRELPAAGVEALLGVAGPDADTSLMVRAELRQLGGALGRPHPGAGALPQLDGQFAFFCCTVAPDAQTAGVGLADARRTVDALGPWSAGHCLNLTEAQVDVSAAFPAEHWERLRRIRRTVDPDGLIVANHPVPPTVDMPRPR
ncbi:MAG: FAD-binding oxidoreductase [Actinomycetes bacterium]